MWFHLTIHLILIAITTYVVLVCLRLNDRLVPSTSTLLVGAAIFQAGDCISTYALIEVFGIAEEGNLALGYLFNNVGITYGLCINTMIITVLIAWLILCNRKLIIALIVMKALVFFSNVFVLVSYLFYAWYVGDEKWQTLSNLLSRLTT